MLLLNGGVLGSDAVERNKTDLVKDIEVVHMVFVEN